jgi:hypothetical protein
MPKKLHLPRVPVPKPQQAFKTRKNELDRKAKHKGNRFDECTNMKMDVLKRWEDAVVDEDAPANSAGGGGIAGIGIGPKGEPGVDLRKKRLDDMKRDAHLNEAKSKTWKEGKYTYGICENCGDRCNTHPDASDPLELCADCDAVTCSCCTKYSLNAPFCAKCQKLPSNDDRIFEAIDQDAMEMSNEQRFKYLTQRLASFQIGPMGMNPTEEVIFKQIAKEYKDLRKKLKKDAPPQLGEARTLRLPKGLKEETFAGAQVFEVDMDKVMSSRFGKNRYHRYSKYVGEDEKGEEIRQHGRSRKSGDIILKDSKTAVMTYLRRKKPIG